jgi:hypothetical protein
LQKTAQFKGDKGMNTTLTSHALLRTAQRNLASKDLKFLLNYGRMANCGGAVHLFLGKRDIPVEMRSDDSIAKLVGTTLILANDDLSLITAYKNNRAWKSIRRKSKWDLTRRGRRAILADSDKRSELTLISDVLHTGGYSHA